MTELFERYPVTPDSVRTSGANLSRSGDPIFDVATSAAEATIPASDNVLGMLVQPIRLLLTR